MITAREKVLVRVSSGEETGKAQLEAQREMLGAEYDLQETAYLFGGSEFRFLSVLDSYALLDRISPEEFVKDEQMPYWAEIWPAAITLSEYIMERLELRGKSVIEIGSGVAMASIVAARKGAEVLATDYSLEALRFARYNAMLNNVALETGRLDWRLVRGEERFDVLFAADVLYERVNLLPIVTAIDKLLKPDGAAYIADPRRRLAEQFLELVHENGFSVSSCEMDYTRAKQKISINIYKLERDHRPS
jgi:predicted nicotinamide N-methyase